MPPTEAKGRWNWMSTIAGVLLAGYILFALYGLLSPSDDPQRGMADGFLILVILILASLGALLWFGVTRSKVWLVRVVFVIVVLPGLSPVARLIYVLTHGT